MQSMDQYTIEEVGVKGLVLMENAGSAWVSAVESYLSLDSQIIVFCGAGNNGGDGYVIARILKSKGFNCSVVAVATPKSKDCSTNAVIWQKYGKTYTWNEWTAKNTLPSKKNIWIDAILGTGISTPLRHNLQAVLQQINNYPGQKIAVDIPSGINASTGDDLGSALKVDLTVTFQLEKVGHHLHPGKEFSGSLKCQNISLKEYFPESASKFFLIDRQLLSPSLPERKPTDYKNILGHMAACCGCKGTMGAAWLVAYSGLKIGAGLSTAIIPDAQQDNFWLKSPELMSISQEEVTVDTLNLYDALVVGCGLGRSGSIWSKIEPMLQLLTTPFVLDADAFYGIKDWNSLPLSRMVLTPHAGEFQKISGYQKPNSNAERIKQGFDFIARYPTTLVLKGAPTIIFHKDGAVYFNSTGNPGMATAGSGDVLSGIIGGFLAQGVSPERAAVAGVWFHGRSGDIARSKRGEAFLSAVDLIDNLGEVWAEFNPTHKPI
jgi:NAD(P)H-hydrate epimerase